MRKNLFESEIFNWSFVNKHCVWLKARIYFVFVLVFSICFISNSFAAAISSTAAGGNWSSPATWVGNVVPSLNDDVTIINNAQVNVNITTANLNSLTVNGTLNVNIGTFNVNISSGGSITIGSTATVVFGASNLITGGQNGSGRGVQLTVRSGATLRTANIFGFASELDGSNRYRGSLNIGPGNNPARPAVFQIGINLEYNGTLAQSVGTAIFDINNLIINNAAGVSLSRNINVNNNLVIGSNVSNSVFADAGFTITRTGTGIFSIVSGKFNIGSGTVGTTFPSYPASNILLSVGSTIEYVANATQTISLSPAYQNLVLSGSGVKNSATGILTIKENFTINGSYNYTSSGNTIIEVTGDILGGGSLVQGNGSITLFGNWLFVGSFNFSSAEVVLKGNNKAIVGATGLIFNTLRVDAGASYTNNNPGTLTVNTNIAGSGLLRQGNGATLDIKGGVDANLDASVATNTVRYSGGNQTVKAVTYHHLELTTTTAGNFNKTINGLRTINGNFTLSAPAGSTVATTTSDGDMTIGGTVNIGANTTLSLGTFNHNVGGNWVKAGSFNPGNSTVTFNGNGAQDIGASNFNHVVFGGANTKKATGVLQVAGNLTINNGSSFEAGNQIHEVGGNWTKDPTGNFIATGSTINFNGTNTQTINASNFNNVAFNNGGTKTAGGALTIAGNVDINSNFTAGSNTHTVGGNWNNNNSFTPGTSTVTFNGSGPQTIGGTTGSQTFNNLIINKPAGTLLNTGGSLTALTVSNLNQQAGNFTAPASLTVQNGYTQSANTTFTSGNTRVAITGDWNTAGAVSLPANTATVSGNLVTSGTFGAGANNQLSVSGNLVQTGTFTGGNRLTVSGNWQADNAATLTTNNTTATITGDLTGTGNIAQGNGHITLGGSWLNTGNFTASTNGIVNLNGVNKEIRGANGLAFNTVSLGTNASYTNNNPGTLTINTNIAGSGTLRQSNGAILDIKGGVDATLDASVAVNTVRYSGGAQAIKPTTYHHLELTTNTSSANKTINGLRTINGNFTLSAPAGSTVATTTSDGIMTIGGTVTIGTGTTLNLGAFNHNVGGDWVKTGTFNPGSSTVTFNGAGAQSIGASNFNHVVFGGANTKKATGVLQVAGNLTINNGSSFEAGNQIHEVGGNWNNNGIFIATGSTINFNGTNTQTINASNFNNVVFNNGGTKTAGGALTIAGNVDINSNFTAGSNTHTVGGNWNNSGGFVETGSTIDFNGTAIQRINAGRFNNISFSNTGVKVSDGSLNISGNVNIGPNANFDANEQTHTLRGNWTKDATGIFQSVNSNIRFLGTSVQTVSASNFHHVEISTTSSGNSVGIVKANGNLEINGNLTINGRFDAGSGSFTHRLRGDLVNNTGALADFARGNSSFVFDGANNQKILSQNSPRQITAFNNIAIDKTNSLLLVEAPVTIYGAVGFYNGYIKTTAAAPFIFSESGTVQTIDPLALPRNASFVDGPVSKRLVVKSQSQPNPAPFTFPIGKNGRYNPATVSNAQGIANNPLVAEYFPADPRRTFPNAKLTARGLKVISSCEYWNINKSDANGLSMDLTLGWKNNACGDPAYVSDPANVVIALKNSADWSMAGPANRPSEVGVNRAEQTITWSGVNNFGDFTLGSTSFSNVLPVTFANFTATQKEEGVQLSFSNLTEEDVAVYHVERSANGTDFKSIGTLAPRVNTNSRADYTYLDQLPLNGANYYRIRALETTGKVVYSDVVMLRTNGKQNSFVLYPNPARIHSTLSLQMGNLPAGRYQVKVFNQVGQLLRVTQFSHRGGFVSTPLSTQGMAAGHYYVELSGEQQQVQHLVIQ